MGQLYSVLTRCIALCVIFLSLCLTGFANIEQGKIKVTLEVNNKRRADVLHLLEKKTGMIFFYASNLFNTEEKISVSAVDQTLDDILDKVFEGTGMEWNYERQKFISIKPKRKMVVEKGLPVDSNIVSMALTGTVIAADGTVIPGATILLKGDIQGTTADDKGNFSIVSHKKNQVLVVSSIGFQTREIVVTGKTILVKLTPAVNDLDATVIKGYYNTTKRFNTGAVTKVNSDVISNQPISDPVLALQGQVSGLQITQQSGLPGSNPIVRLRGQNSIANGNDPLYIIDGVPFTSKTLTSAAIGGGAATLSPFSSINPSDIESVEVLKDADATAIYGSRGANGVILITTKRGLPGETRINVNAYTGIGKISKKLDLLNTQQYLAMRREALLNDNQTPQDWDVDVNGKWDTTRYTDWQKVFVGGTAKISNMQLSVYEGNQTTQFTAGGSYRRETTVFPGQFGNKKMSAFISLNDKSLNNKLSTNISASYLKDNTNFPVDDITSYMFTSPNAPSIYKQNGELNWEDDTFTNPFGTIGRTAKTNTGNLIGNFSLTYNILKGLDLKVSTGYNNIQADQTNTFPLSAYPPSSSQFTYLREVKTSNREIKTWNLEPQISFEKRMKSGVFRALLGSSFQETITTGFAQSASDFPSDALMENLTAAVNTITLDNSYTQYRYSAIFARLNYDLKERYLFNITARRDGSSRFGPKNRFGNFGAIGLAWLASEETFMKDLWPTLSYMKVRSSYGITGNDQLTDYQYLATYNPYPFQYLGTTGLSPTRIENSTYGWESVKKLEFGLEIGILKDRIFLNADYYHNRTGNQLVGYALPAITGFASVYANLPAIIQNTGLELDLSTKNINYRSFTWRTNFNISFPRNKLVSYPNLAGSPYANKYIVGRSLFIQKLFHYTGVDSKTGLYTFQDKNGDNEISRPDDQIGVKEISQKFFGGLQNSFQLNSWQLDIFIQFSRQMSFTTKYIPQPGVIFANQPTSVLSRWNKEGGNNNIQLFTQDYGSLASAAELNYQLSDGPIENTSYIRLKNLSLAYSLPAKTRKYLNLKETRIYVLCQNLFTISSFKDADPEVPSIIKLPPLRIITIGASVTL